MAVPRALLACLLVALMAGCAEQLSVSNQTDNFALGGQVAAKSGRETYTWHNTQGKADVDFGGQSGTGELSVILRDATGKQVYAKMVSGASQGGSSESTASGTPGDWQVIIAFDGFTGQVGLNVRAKYAAGGSCFGFSC